MLVLPSRRQAGAAKNARTSHFCRMFASIDFIEFNASHTLIYIYKAALCVCLFASYRPHTFPGAALRDRLTDGPPYGRKWTCEPERKKWWIRIRCQYCCKDALQTVELEEMHMIAFFMDSLPFVLPMEEVMKPHTLANTSRARHQSICIWLPAAPIERRISDSKEPGGSSLPRDFCSGRHQPGTKPGEYGEPPVQRDSRTCTGGNQKRKKWAPVPRDHRVRRARDQERAANRRAGERVVSLEVEVSYFGVSNPRTHFLFVEGTHGS